MKVPGTLAKELATELATSIYLYSQSFTKEENIMLLEHIKNTFGIEFILANIPNGSGYHLRLHKNKEVRNFLDIVRPYVNEIPSMKYKSDIDSKLIDTRIRYSNRFPDKTVNITNKVTIDNSYSKDDEAKIIEMLQNGFSYKDIAEELGRSYHGLYDKVRRMRGI